MCVDLSLGFLFCSIDLYVCLCASTMLFYMNSGLLWTEYLILRKIHVESLTPSVAEFGVRE